jgi:hypothetical protein
VCVFLCCDPSRAAIAGAPYDSWKYVDRQNVGHWTVWTSSLCGDLDKELDVTVDALSSAEEDTVGKTGDEK